MTPIGNIFNPNSFGSNSYNPNTYGYNAFGANMVNFFAPPVTPDPNATKSFALNAAPPANLAKPSIENIQARYLPQPGTMSNMRGLIGAGIWAASLPVAGLPVMSHSGGGSAAMTSLNIMTMYSGDKPKPPSTPSP